MRSFYTTKMSGNAKAICKRFEKINSKPMKLSKMLTIICMAVFIGVFACSTLVIAKLEGNSEKYNLNITNNGAIIELENKPFVENGIVYVPLREFFEEFGMMEHENAKMIWDNGVVLISLFDKNTRFDKTSEYTGYAYKIEIGKNELMINPKELVPMAGEYNAVFIEKMQAAPVLVNNTTYVPFEYIQRIVERADNAVQSYEDKYNLDIFYTGHIFTVGYPFDETYNITHAFGKRVHPITNEEKFHEGVDFSAPEGTKVFSGIDGRIASAGFDSQKGNYVTVANEQGIEITYSHLREAVKRAGNEVSKREVIGYVGNTGVSTGAHLHMEMKLNSEYVDPEMYFDIPDGVKKMIADMENKDWENIMWRKGYLENYEWKYSCIEPTEAEKDLSMYLVWGTTEGIYDDKITNDSLEYSITAVAKIVVDETSPQGRIYEICYTSGQGGRDLGTELFSDMEYLNESVLDADDKFLLNYMCAY